MTPATAVLEELTGLGVALEVHGDRLRFHPAEKVTPDLRDRLREHKAAILELVRAGSSESSDAPATPPAMPIRPPNQQDDCDRAVIAACNGDPLPDGWGVIPGEVLIGALEADAEWKRVARKLRGGKAPRLGPGECCGCLLLVGDAPAEWDGSPVCPSCFGKTIKYPGFQITLSRAVRWARCED